MARRKLVVEIVGDSRQFERTLGRVSRATSTFNKVIAGAGIAVGLEGARRAIEGLVTEASGLNEEINKSEVIFGDSAKAVTSWSKTTAKAIGVSQKAALEAAGAFGAILQTSGLDERTAGEFSKRLVGLAADMASFNNIDVDDALTKLRSGLAGEAEPLRRVGVLLSEARVKAEAYRLGIAETGAELTEQQKVQARYAVILKDTAKQQGDFARTSDSLANQSRILSAQFDNLRASLGTSLLPVILDITKGLNEFLGDAENQQRLTEGLESGVRQLGEAFKFAKDTIVAIAGPTRDAVDALGGLKNTLKLLAAAFVAVKVTSFVNSIGLLAPAAKRSAVQVTALRTALLRLGAIGVITVGVEVLFNRDEITKEFNELTDKLPVGRGKEVEIGVGSSPQELRKLREEFVKLEGEGSDQVKQLDKVISKLTGLQKTAKLASGSLRDNLRPPSGGGLLDGIKDALGGSKGPSSNAKDILGGLNDALSAFRKAGSDAVKKTKTAIDKADKEAAALAAQTKQREGFDALIDSLALGFDKAEDAGKFEKALAALGKTEKAILAQIKVEGRTAELERQLFEVRQKRSSIQAALKTQAQDAAQARQFRALGFAADGGDLVPGIANLRKQLASLTERLGESGLNLSSKLRSQLAGARKVLSGELGKAKDESREKIKELFDTIRGTLNQETRGPLTKTRNLLSSLNLNDLNLPGDALKNLQGQLSRFNTGLVALGPGATAFSQPVGGAGGPLVVQLQLDSRTVAEQTFEDVTVLQQKRDKNKSTSTRGRFSGI